VRHHRRRSTTDHVSWDFASEFIGIARCAAMIVGQRCAERAAHNSKVGSVCEAIYVAPASCRRISAALAETQFTSGTVRRPAKSGCRGQNIKSAGRMPALQEALRRNPTLWRECI
jgi:hypothetical protein